MVFLNQIDRTYAAALDKDRTKVESSKDTPPPIETSVSKIPDFRRSFETERPLSMKTDGTAAMDGNGWRRNNSAC